MISFKYIILGIFIFLMGGIAFHLFFPNKIQTGKILSVQTANPTNTPSPIATVTQTPTPTKFIQPETVDCSPVTNTITKIRNSFLITVNYQTVATSKELSNRGILPTGKTSVLYKQNMSQVIQPIYSLENEQISLVCREAYPCPCP